ncbi:ATP-dependent RNA helicase TDRD9-like protein, putative [Babesia ovata]|uniref:ATP-dependent RNA helicase TDRD9-like protein, putative n=1 Tax=Babesia ovata TaxID=189622 RepID=A0A2H6KHC6_9APIC|nr:ATP-dependent RNA helicase TDRD9-like protein, putative [Babesia ovata]GBE62395.1 ATP-dependent RNA helicase TDRD9-like protein, putative [Babesia ovata]
MVMLRRLMTFLKVPYPVAHMASPVPCRHGGGGGGRLADRLREVEGCTCQSSVRRRNVHCASPGDSRNCRSLPQPHGHWGLSTATPRRPEVAGLGVEQSGMWNQALPRQQLRLAHPLTASAETVMLHRLLIVVCPAPLPQAAATGAPRWRGGMAEIAATVVTGNVTTPM